jgi:hypothetical protein
VPERPVEPERRESPIPPEWSDGTKELRELARSVEQWFQDF